MKKAALFVFLFLSIITHAQVGINSDSSDPDDSAMLDVKSTEKGFLPPRMTANQRDSILNPAEGLFIYNLDRKTWQGFNGTFWENTNGTSCVPNTPSDIIGNISPAKNAVGEVYSTSGIPFATWYQWTVPNDAIITNGQGTTSIIVDFGTESGNVSVSAQNGCGNSDFSNLFVYTGTALFEFYQGGIVFYHFQPGDPSYVEGEVHGLICAIIDQAQYPGAEWGCSSTYIGTGTGIGTGEQNTIDIETYCTTTGIAADICANLSLNGYTDWFLPSKDELNEMYQNKDAINTTATSEGGNAFDTGKYWSSSEFDTNQAWSQTFNNGGQYEYEKLYLYIVRAIRSF